MRAGGAAAKPLPSARVVQRVVSWGFRSALAFAALPLLLVPAQSGASAGPASVPAPRPAQLAPERAPRRAPGPGGEHEGVLRSRNGSRVQPGRRAARPERRRPGHGDAPRRGRAERRSQPRRHVPDRRRPGPGIGARLRPRRRGERRALPLPLPRLHARRLRRPRHRDSGLLDCPDAAASRTRRTPSARPPRHARPGSARSATSTGRPSTRRTSSRSGRHSASARSLSTASPTGRSSRWRMRSRIPTTSSACSSTPSCRPSSRSVQRQRPAGDAGDARRVLLGRRCSAATGDFPGDVTALANKLAATPLRLAVREPNGAKKQVRVDGLELISVVIDADLNPGLAAELPAVVRAALRGNTQPLARLADLHDGGSQETAVDLSFALYAATVCRDGPFPWAPDTPVDARRRARAVGARSAPARRPRPLRDLGRAVRQRRLLPRLAQPVGRRRARDRAPPERPDARRERRLRPADADRGRRVGRRPLPPGELLVVPGVGHSTVTADFSGLRHSSRPHLDDRRRPAGRMRAPDSLSFANVPALPALPARAHRLSPAATLAIVKATLREAEAAWLDDRRPHRLERDGSRHLTAAG